MAVRFAIRRDNTTNWATGNPVLASGEPAFDTQLNTLRIGDGKTHYNDLPDFTGTILPGSIELGASATALQYRIGGGAWTDLVPISDLAGPPGNTGPTGLTGPTGPTGPPGAAGAAGVVNYTTIYNAIGWVRIRYTGSAWPDRTTALTAKGITIASLTADIEWYSIGYPDIIPPGTAVVGDTWWEEAPSS